MKQKKILFVIPKLCNGGAERRVAFLANHIAQDTRYHVYMLSFWETEGDYTLDEKVTRLHLSKKLRFNHHANDKKRLVELTFIFKKLHPNVVFSMHPPVAYFCKIAGFWQSFKLIDLIEIAPNHMQHLERRKKGWSRADAIVVQCQKQKELMPVYQNKCVVINNPVSDVFLKIRKDYSASIKKFITVARFDPEKNQTMLLNAWKIVHDKYHDVTLDFYGRGPQRDEVIKYAETIGVSSCTRFVERSDSIEKEYATHDAFILPSNFEGMPNALLEAMGTGLACISTNCDTGPSDLITNGENGILVDVDNIPQMVDAITFFIEHPNQAVSYAKNAKESVSAKFNSEIIMKSYFSLLEKVLRE